MQHLVVPRADCAHVFRIACDISERELCALKEVLAADERVRADRFRQLADQRRYVVARSNLRRILGSMLDCSATKVAFQYGQFRKPELCSTFGSSLHFNVSHSGNWVLIGITNETPIGVDVEELREMNNIAGVVRSTFSSAEFQQWLAVPTSLQREAFFRAWTCKEALIKAIGTGISIPTESVVVEVDPSKPARLIQFDLQSQSRASFRLETFSPAAGYWAAVACDSRVSTIQHVVLSPV